MAILKSTDDSDDDLKSNESQPLIPGLPDEISEICLLYLPYPYQTLARSVSSSWNRVIINPNFLMSRKSLSLSLPYLFVFAFNKSTLRIQWQAFDPRSRRWFILPPMPSPGVNKSPNELACASIPLQGKLFVMGGGLRTEDTENSMRNTIVYRSSTNQWTVASPMLTARSHFAAGSVNGKIMAVGGSGGGGLNYAIKEVECYDPEKDSWRAVRNMRMGLARYESAVIGSKMYVTEGWTWPFLSLPRGEVYDMERDTWRNMSDGMREGWTGMSVVIGDRLFVMFEYGDCSMKVYSKEDDTWRYVSGDRFPCEVMRRPLAVSGVEGRIYVVSSGLNVAIGKLLEEGQNGDFTLQWEVVVAPLPFRNFDPSNCHLLYA